MVEQAAWKTEQRQERKKRLLELVEEKGQEAALASLVPAVLSKAEREKQSLEKRRKSQAKKPSRLAREKTEDRKKGRNSRKLRISRKLRDSRKKRSSRLKRQSRKERASRKHRLSRKARLSRQDRESRANRDSRKIRPSRFAVASYKRKQKDEKKNSLRTLERAVKQMADFAVSLGVTKKGGKAALGRKRTPVLADRQATAGEKFLQEAAATLVKAKACD